MNMSALVRNGTTRSDEWLCLCPEGAAIRAASLRRCPRCGAVRPDTAGIAHAVDRTRRIVDAIECLDRMSDKVGRYQAMEYVLDNYSERRGGRE